MPRTNVKPGVVIKEELMAQGAMSIAALHRAYKERIQQSNSLTERRHRGMTYHSFNTYVERAKLQGLVIPVSDTPMLFPTKEPVELKGIRDGDVLFPQEQRLYALTQKGMNETDAWIDLAKADRIRASLRRLGLSS